MQLPRGHHHGLADHLSNLLLWELLIFLFGRRGPRWRHFTLWQRGLGWSLLITNLEKTELHMRLRSPQPQPVSLMHGCGLRWALSPAELAVMSQHPGGHVDITALKLNHSHSGWIPLSSHQTQIHKTLGELTETDLKLCIGVRLNFSQ